MTLRRGFKTEANRYAVELRGELGLMPHSKLCPWQLAELLGFKVVALSYYANTNPGAVKYFTQGKGSKELSAITLPYGRRHLIIYNDSHEPGRQSADLAHECAHAILLHKIPELMSGFETRYYDAVIEEEASWLGPALLISDAAALLIARRGYSLEEASRIYGVSIDLVRFRLNVTGAFRRAA